MILDALLDPARPAQAVDQLLANGLGEAAEAVRRWSVGRRLDALVALRQAHSGDVEAVPLQCGACREAFVVDIDLAACRAPVLESEVAFEVAGHTRRARLPTGEDQHRWQHEHAPLRLVADSLMLDGRPCGGEATVDGLGRALSARDPLRELPVQAVCPECGHLAEHPVDLEAHLVGAFAQAQHELLSQVAELAQAYHWSEAEITAMPAWRRQFYLQRLEAR